MRRQDEAGRRLRQHLARLGRRLRLGDGLRLGAASLWLPLLALVSTALAARLWPLQDWRLWLFLPLEIWLIALGLFCLLRPYPLYRVARRLDQELGLKDRLATALELEERRLNRWAGGQVKEEFIPSSGISSSLVSLQLADAAATAERLLPGDMAWRLPGRLLGLAGGLALLVLVLLLLPNPMDAVLAEQAAIREAAAAQARAVEQARQELEAATEPVTEERAKALQALAELAKALTANQGQREQALADISTAQARLRELQRDETLAQQAITGQITAQLQALSRGQAGAGDLAGSGLPEMAARLANIDAASRGQTAEALESLAGEAAAASSDLAEALLDLAEAIRAGDTAVALSAASRVQAALARTDRAANLQQALAAAQAALENSRQQLAAGAPSNQLATAAGQAPGQGQQPGQGQGQGQSPGSGGGSQADQLPGANRSGAAADPSRPNRPATISDDEIIYAPGAGPHQDARPEFVAGQEGEQGQVTVREEQSPQGNLNPALVPYRDVYESYAETAAETMERERIPAELQDYVRNYFSQLAPE